MHRIPTILAGVRAATSYLTHPARGWTVLVGANPIISFMGMILAQTAGVTTTHRLNVEQAAEFLRKQDATLTLTA